MIDNSKLHPSYIEHAPLIELVHDTMRDDRIKKNKLKHLPVSGAIAARMKNSKTSAGAIATYDSLAEGGLMPSVVSEALNEYLGVFFTNPITIPESYEDKIVTNTGLKTADLTRNVANSVFTDGRRVLVVDAPQSDEDGKPIGNGDPYITEYQSLKFEYWETDNDGNLIYAKFNDGEITEGTNKGKKRYRVYTLTNGVAEVATYLDNDIENEPVTIGKLDYLPVFPIGSIDDTPEWDELPLLKQAEVMRQYYRVSCYYYRAIDKANDYTTAVSGITDGEAEKMVAQGVGNGAFWYSEKKEASYQFLEVQAKGISAAKLELERLEDQAKQYGIQFVAGANEAAETVRMRKEAKLMSISTVAESCGTGITKALTTLGELEGKPFTDEVKINLPSTAALFTIDGIKAAKSWSDAGLLPLQVAYNQQKKMQAFENTDIETFDDYVNALQEQNTEEELA